jgi:hypothetical protein
MTYSLSKLNPDFLKYGKRRKKSDVVLYVLVVLSLAILYVHSGYALGEAWDYYKVSSVQRLD